MTKYVSQQQTSKLKFHKWLLFQAVTLTVALQALFAQECLFVELSECHRQNNNNNPPLRSLPQ